MNTKNNIRSIAAVLASTLVLLGAMPLIAMADNPVPVTTNISPSSVVTGSAGFNLTVYGNNFVPGSTVNVNGSSRSTTYVSSGQLTASIPSSDLSSLGTFNITVTNPAPGGGTSNAQAFTVGNSVPATTSISPSQVASGSAGLTLAVNGSGFLAGSLVNINGSARATSYISPTQLTASVSASDLANPGNFNVTVTNPMPGGGTSNAQILTVTGNNPTPTLSSISPTDTMVGGNQFVMTVYGTNFNTGSVVTFNGMPRSTTYVSSGQLTAIILASDIAITGPEAVMVTNPLPGGGTSNAILFNIDPTSITPGLPNTGFGPTAQTGVNTGLLAASGVIAGILLTAVIVRKRALATK